MWSAFVVAIVVATPCNCGCNLWLRIVGAIVGAVLAADLGICATRPVIPWSDLFRRGEDTGRVGVPGFPWRGFSRSEQEGSTLPHGRVCWAVAA